MAVKSYELTFAPVLPRMRKLDEILADLDHPDSGQATSTSRAAVSQIELRIRQGDELYRRGQYEPAVDEFRTARSLIFELMSPGFDSGLHTRRKDVALPVSSDIEKRLLAVSLQVADAIRPTVVRGKPVFAADARDGLPDSLAALSSAGFRETQRDEEVLELAATNGVALLHEGKTEAAIELMTGALAKADRLGQKLDRSVKGALALNLAGAYLQLGDTANAAKMADLAAADFAAAKDPVGEAQALHAAAVAALKAGQADNARILFARAAEIVKRETPTEAAGASTTPTVPLTPLRPTLGGITIEPVQPIGGVTLSPTRALASPFVGRIGDGALRPAMQLSREVADLAPVARMEARAVTFRVPGAEGWGVLELDPPRKEERRSAWQIGIPVGDKIVSFQLGEANDVAVGKLVSGVYQGRVGAKRAVDLEVTVADASTTTAYLTHLYAFVLPVKIGDTYLALGRFDKAEEYFLQAAQYSFLNKELEATMLWVRLARTALEAGDSLYRNERLPEAKAQYERLVTETGTAPNSTLYTTAALATPAAAAKAVIDAITKRPLPALNWEIAGIVLDAYTRLQQIRDGLDFYGLALSPIHTFEYLQGVARAFAQEASQAEREFVNFKSHAELEEATRRDLQTAKAMAEAEANARHQQYLAALDDEAAALRAHQLAVKRRDDAVAQRAQYASASASQIWAAAAAQAQGMGEDSWYSEISELADKLARGESISGPRGKLAAAYTLWSGRKTRDYELKRMQDNIDELTVAITIAQEQLEAARRRTSVAEISWQAGLQRASMAAASLTAFEAEFFTPEAWSKMADLMREIARSHLFRAIRIAKLMERAFNFEQDTDLEVIKDEYGQAVAVVRPGRDPRLLGGESLLNDIESFTYEAITTKTRKSTRIKDVLSLSSVYPAQFEEFRRTGLLTFETDLYEFDRLHPGFYGQRIEAVELEVIGVLPETGLNGTLTAGGVTSYRKRDGSTDKRVHQVDTMALSEFALRNDIFLYSAETGVRGLFQGIGLGSTWQFHLPRRSNDFDFRRIFDVHLVLYYTATFDAALRTKVLQLPPRPGELASVRTYALRHDFPDAWYAFYADGTTTFTIDNFRLPSNQTKFKAQAVSFRVMTKPGVSAKNIEVAVTAPNGTSATVKTDADGVFSTDRPKLAPIKGSDPLGAWQIAVTGGPSLTEDGVVKHDRIHNLQVGLEYSFEYVPEASV
jgi:tetratricopeptide (TPR) repeat protein